MPNIKPIALATGHISNEEIRERQETEEKLKGNTTIDVKPPKELSANGKKLYKHIISLLPNGFLSGGDTFVVGIVAESLDRMQKCQIKLNKDGLFDEDGTENQAVRTYEKYSKIFEKFSAKLGLSPKDRASLAVLVINDKDNQEDQLLKILKGDDD
ncbi:phage terminase, small subunit, putative, P27 family [Anaerosporobacter mobilis DSM 15930]|jgi:P27 family predicted phage terminase small subunit|uniref:Phage terminase, small subunit, putative, P27 family n=1 Tax=Anaerosporobacter mobilis DSM 15930 TaxID=1120996 RepID=A0A1M7NKN9_9FIRM|nr:phage terminase small subunit P27 family [Anaerosporobacter mobilis]SHN04297.1 phage terminase, small subunit, putative, P27 family [Anaerosporobacter mobilis DSM 15930]